MQKEDVKNDEKKKDDEGEEEEEEEEDEEAEEDDDEGVLAEEGGWKAVPEWICSACTFSNQYTENFPCFFIKNNNSSSFSAHRFPLFFLVK